MEKETITIEIKQEVSVTLLWIVAGVILELAAFFVTPGSTELWPALNAAGIAAALFLSSLLAYVIRKPLPMRSRAIVGVCAVLALGCTAFNWAKMEEQTKWQADQLMKIRTFIGRGIRINEMPQPLLKTLDAYHRQGTRKSKTLADEFRTLYPDAQSGANIHKPEGEWDLLTVMVTTLKPDSIVLVSQETYVKGRDPAFRNLDGKSGMVQEKFVLTERGMTHVSEN